MKNLSCIAIIILALGFLIFPAGHSYAADAISVDNDTELEANTERLMGLAEQLRGLSFYDSLPVQMVSTEEIGNIINDELDRQIDDANDRMFSELFELIGLIPGNQGLRDMYQELAEEQVAGLYDSHEKKFYVVDVDVSDMIGDMFGDMFGDLGNLGGLVEGFLKGMGFDMTDIIIVHELTHALDDQHFDIDSELNRRMAMNSDDMQLAYQSLVEGNATRIMNDYSYGSLGIDPSQLEGMADMQMDMMDGMLGGSFMEKMMIVPYLKGEEFTRHLISLGGQQDLDDAFLDPPQSMEQILHPDRYTGHRDEPSWVDNPNLSSVLDGWEFQVDDTLGELLIATTFEQLAWNWDEATVIADGWDGDRVTSWMSPDGDIAMAWVTVWDNDGEARDFYDAYKEAIRRKYRNGEWEDSRVDLEIMNEAGFSYAVEIYDYYVVIVEGVPRDQIVEALDTAWETEVEVK
jgi:hypothetical protein